MAVLRPPAWKYRHYDTKLDTWSLFPYHDRNDQGRTLMARADRGAAALAAAIAQPPSDAAAPDVATLLFGTTEPPPFPANNIFPLEWHTETPKLLEIYERGRDPGWSPAALPWHTLDPAAFSADQRY